MSVVLMPMLTMRRLLLLLLLRCWSSRVIPVRRSLLVFLLLSFFCCSAFAAVAAAVAAAATSSCRGPRKPLHFARRQRLLRSAGTFWPRSRSGRFDRCVKQKGWFVNFNGCVCE